MLSAMHDAPVPNVLPAAPVGGRQAVLGTGATR